MRCCCFITKGHFCAVQGWLGTKVAELKVTFLWVMCWKETSGDWKSGDQTEQKDAAAEALSASVLLPAHLDGWQETPRAPAKAFSLLIRYQSKLKSRQYGIRLVFPCRSQCVLSNPSGSRLVNLVHLTRVTRVISFQESSSLKHFLFFISF